MTAHRFGCRVPTMGIAFMVFIPLLYTDVSDAWRLHSRKQRILISASGMIVELYLAGIATFLWAFMDDGAARDIAFYIATVGWIRIDGHNCRCISGCVMRLDNVFAASLDGFSPLPPQSPDDIG